MASTWVAKLKVHAEAQILRVAQHGDERSGRELVLSRESGAIDEAKAGEIDSDGRQRLAANSVAVRPRAWPFLGVCTERLHQHLCDRIAAVLHEQHDDF